MNAALQSRDRNSREIATALSQLEVRHHLDTLAKANGEDVKTIQAALRHANFKSNDGHAYAGVTAITRSHDRVVRQGIELSEDGIKAQKKDFRDPEIRIGSS